MTRNAASRISASQPKSSHSMENARTVQQASFLRAMATTVSRNSCYRLFSQGSWGLRNQASRQISNHNRVSSSQMVLLCNKIAIKVDSSKAVSNKVVFNKVVSNKEAYSKVDLYKLSQDSASRSLPREVQFSLG